MDTCVPYYFKAYGMGEPNSFSEFDFYYNDDITIRCFNNYNLKGQQIYYHLFFEGDANVCEVFTEIKKALIFCETYTKKVHYGE